jgi:signal transduction histidine kinase
MPRLTLRAQLTVLYAGPFLVSGAALLTVPLLGASNSVPAGTRPDPGQADAAGGSLGPIVTLSAVALAAMLLVSIAVGWFVAGRFLRPLRTITATARDISATNLHRRLGRTGRGDEFTELARTLDDLFGRLDNAFASQRHFVANAAHELRTPLTAERTILQVALADPDVTVDSLRAACREVLTLGQAQERLIDALLTLASGEQGVERREPFDLADLAGTAVRAAAREAGRRGVAVDTALAPACAAGDRRLAESLVANLVDNAIRHNRPGGHANITTRSDPSGASIRITNTGPLVPTDELERLFEPFQRLGGQRVRHPDGHGLGLAIVRAIALAHGATLVPHSVPGGGLDMTVTFPHRASTDERSAR